jgi:hypothetical protein
MSLSLETGSQGKFIKLSWRLERAVKTAIYDVRRAVPSVFVVVSVVLFVMCAIAGVIAGTRLAVESPLRDALDVEGDVCVSSGRGWVMRFEGEGTSIFLMPPEVSLPPHAPPLVVEDGSGKLYRRHKLVYVNGDPIGGQTALCLQHLAREDLHDEL